LVAWFAVVASVATHNVTPNFLSFHKFFVATVTFQTTVKSAYGFQRKELKKLGRNLRK
jgi:hypothetical protein